LDTIKKRQTLQQIGESFGITRERIRQIELEALSRVKVKSSSPNLRAVFAYLYDYLKKQGGLKREDFLLNDLAESSEQNSLFFLLCLAPNMQRFAKCDDFYSFWGQGSDTFAKASVLLKALLKRLKDNKAPLVKETIYGEISQQPRIFVDNLIEASKAVEVGPLGKVGLAIWPEIKPRGVRDAAYLVLKKLGKPLHFQEIANNANGLKGSFFQKRKILPQTVHNELIRDPQFILVGRGVYGLRDWGYSDGTVRDVICGIMKKANMPLGRQEILQQVLQQRLVKENTIFLNLNNKTYFQKDREGKYTLKEI